MNFDMRGRKKCVRRAVDFIATLFLTINIRTLTSTPNYMIYGELGRYPVEIDIKIRIISFWAKIICGKQSNHALCIVYHTICIRNKISILNGYNFWKKY